MYPALNTVPPELLFPRGFALYETGKRPAAIPGHFRTLPLPNGRVFDHHVNLPTSLSHKHSDFVLLAGYAVDLIERHDIGAGIAEALLNQLGRSEDEFFDRIDALAGRFVIIYSYQGRLRALADASGMKSIFYLPFESGIIASHPRMISDAWSTDALPFESQRSDDASGLRDSRRDPSAPFTIERMAALYASQSGERLTQEQIKRIESMFQEFCSTAAFYKIYDYDPDDMFYWEHRLSAWHSQFCVGSDIGFESHALFNARRIMNALLSVPLDDRKKHSVFLSVIRDETARIDWPSHQSHAAATTPRLKKA